MEYTDPPSYLDEVRLYRLGRIREQLVRHDYAGVLVCDPINVRYATDSTNMQIWCARYETRCALIMTDGPVVLFEYADLPHLHEDLAAGFFRRWSTGTFSTTDASGITCACRMPGSSNW